MVREQVRAHTVPGNDTSKTERGQTRFHRIGGRHVRPTSTSVCPPPLLKQTDSDVASPLSPCGLCRQVIREFCALRMPVILVPSDYKPGSGATEKLKETTVEGLLPDSFGPEHLELPRPGSSA